MARALLVFLILFLSTAINLPHGILDHLGLQKSYLMVTLTTIVVTGLIVHRTLFLIILVVGLSLCANMPESFLLEHGIHRDYLLATLVALVLMPYIARHFDEE